MIELIEANWIWLLLALLIGLAVAWLIFRGARRTRVELDRRDALDEDAAPTRRNEALIAQPSAVPVGEPPAPGPVAERTSEPIRVAEPESAEAPAPVVSEPLSENREGPQHTELTRLKGVGSKLATLLRERGVTSIEQIAEWSDEDIDRIDAQLGRFEGRIRRDDWVGQARLLAAGDEVGYAERFGNV